MATNYASRNWSSEKTTDALGTRLAPLSCYQISLRQRRVNARNYPDKESLKLCAQTTLKQNQRELRKPTQKRLSGKWKWAGKKHQTCGDNQYSKATAGTRERGVTITTRPAWVIDQPLSALYVNKLTLIKASKSEPEPLSSRVLQLAVKSSNTFWPCHQVWEGIAWTFTLQEGTQQQPRLVARCSNEFALLGHKEVQ